MPRVAALLARLSPPCGKSRPPCGRHDSLLDQHRHKTWQVATDGGKRIREILIGGRRTRHVYRSARGLLARAQCEIDRARWGHTIGAVLFKLCSGELVGSHIHRRGKDNLPCLACLACMPCVGDHENRLALTREKGPYRTMYRTQIQVPRGLLCSCGGRAEQCGVCTGGVGVASRVRALRRGMLRCDGGGGATCDRNRGEAHAQPRRVSSRTIQRTVMVGH